MTSASSMYEAGHTKFDVWCSGTTQRDGEGGGRGGSGQGDTCAPVGDSCQYMAKTSTIL